MVASWEVHCNDQTFITQTFAPNARQKKIKINLNNCFLLEKIQGTTHSMFQTGRFSCQVTVSSGGMLTQKLNVDDLQFEKGAFDGTMAYAQNKVSNKKIK